MSPEQSRGEPIDERSDVYALSVLFYELLTLRHPLADKTTLHAMIHAISHEPTPFAGMVNHPHQPSVSMDLTWFLRKGLAKDPAERYASVAEMVTRLERRAEGIIPIQCHITFNEASFERPWALHRPTRHSGHRDHACEHRRVRRGRRQTLR